MATGGNLLIVAMVGIRGDMSTLLSFVGWKCMER